MSSDNLKETIGRNLRNIRAERKLTREQMAELVGVSTTFYANLETGNKMMSVTTLEDRGRSGCFHRFYSV